MSETRSDWPYVVLGSNNIPLLEVRAPIGTDVVGLAAEMITRQHADVVIETVPPHLKGQIEELISQNQ